VQFRCRLAAGLLLVVLSASTAHAENATFGLIAGVNAATLNPPTPGTGEMLTMRPGAVFGIYAVIPILKAVSFEPELLYVPRNTRRMVAGVNTDLRVKYLELPLLAKMPMFWGVYITEGISLGFPIEMQGLAPSLGDITNPDVAMIIGGGHNIGKKFAIEFRYESGFRRAVKLDTVPVQRSTSYTALAKLHF